MAEADHVSLEEAPIPQCGAMSALQNPCGVHGQLLFIRFDFPPLPRVGRGVQQTLHTGEFGEGQGIGDLDAFFLTEGL